MKNLVEEKCHLCGVKDEKLVMICTDCVENYRRYMTMWDSDEENFKENNEENSE